MTECLRSHQLVFFQSTSRVGKWRLSLTLVTARVYHLVYSKYHHFVTYRTKITATIAEIRDGLDQTTSETGQQATLASGEDSTSEAEPE